MQPITPEDILQLSEVQLQAIYEGLGIKFIADQAVLEVAGKVAIIIEKSALLTPSEEDMKKLRDQINSLLGRDIELFDPDDDKYEVNLAGNQERQLGRVFSHFEIHCSRWSCKKVNYYKYLKLEANTSVSNDGWIKIIQFVLCVIAVIGLLVLLTLIPGGAVVVANFATLATVLATGCVLIVSSTDKRNAFLKAYTAT